MKYLSFFLLFAILGNQFSNCESITCGNHPQKNFYVSNNIELNDLSNCNIVNGSIFINGEYSLTTLEPLKNIERITGKLVILDSHVLDNLKGLHNLKSIDGDDFYLQKYSLVIKHNNNNLDDYNHGLCYMDNVFWDDIVKKGEILIENNSLNCPYCSSVCNGCFGPGPQLCQSCENYTNSNGICLDHCHGHIDNNHCNEIEPGIPEVSISTLSPYSMNISWSEPSNPGGYIYKYELYQNDYLIYITTYNNEDYDETSLTLHYQSNNLLPNTNYSYYVLAYNSNGSSPIIKSYSMTFMEPTMSPSSSPTRAPSSSPTSSPTRAPSSSPTSSPTRAPTRAPSSSPTSSPTRAPTSSPTSSPTITPTKLPTQTSFTSSSKNSDDGLKDWELALIIVGSIIFLVIILLVTRCIKRRQKEQNRLRLSRLEGRIIEKSGQPKRSTLGFSNPMYGNPPVNNPDYEVESITSSETSEYIRDVSENVDSIYLNENEYRNSIDYSRQIIQENHLRQDTMSSEPYDEDIEGLYSNHKIEENKNRN